MSLRSSFVEKVPKRIYRLVDLAYNLWWSWHSEARELFRSLDRPLWTSTSHNPVKILKLISEEKLQQQAKNPRFLRLYDSVCIEYDQLMDTSADNRFWFSKKYPEHEGKLIAYLSMEFGLHQSLPIYSGGLGVLSGDHLKEASDLGINLVATGFLYEQGYFRQLLPLHGWQEAIYQDNDFTELPIEPMMRNGGKPLLVPIELDDHIVYCKVWHVQVGRICLYLLDTNIDQNAPWDRDLTDRLYGGDQEMRLKQEIVLGVGSVRTLRMLGLNPDVWHLNEGHCAFSLLERIREYVESGESFDYAVQSVRGKTVFTTHTPVPAGHDTFNFTMVRHHISSYCNRMSIDPEEFLALGRYGEGQAAAFNMTVLALRMSYLRNTVSKLHCQVTMEMFEPLWNELKVLKESDPVIPIVNGVHVPTWLPGNLRNVFKRRIDPNWMDKHDDPRIWEQIDDIPDRELWEVHFRSKIRLFRFIREKARAKRVSKEWEPEKLLMSGALLDPEVLTIGFARRFATYKRANLIFKDIKRLRKILNDPYHPVQLIFAGKAHPADDPAKYLIQEIIHHTKDPELGHRIVFLEDYDLAMAKFLVQGVDLWLNTPLRPREASGTSGMKAAMNCTPNFSILDGWWAEGYTGKNGWAIGDSKSGSSDRQEQDLKDSQSLYDTLENEIIPLYYDVDVDGIPRGWIEIMKESAKTSIARFSMRKMLKDYTEKLYVEGMKFGDIFPR
ncbi:MAG: alpha-glucan family phosphorylase [Candidatus Odinarchaeota archaeon]